jgi:hypothetical protein
MACRASEHSNLTSSPERRAGVRKCAAEQGMSKEEALKRDMEAMSKDFVEKGAEVYSHPGSGYLFSMIQPEELVGGEWAEWYRLTPAQRWLESEKLWQIYLTLGGSLDPELDMQSPFFDSRAPRSRPAHGRTGVRVLRRGRI